MENTPPTGQQQRLALLKKLMVQFQADFKGMLQHYEAEQRIELTEHLIAITNCVQEYQWAGDLKHLEKFGEFDDALLKKYRSKLKQFESVDFPAYLMDFPKIISRKEIATYADAAACFPGQSGIGMQEVMLYLSICADYLAKAKRFLYLNDVSTEIPVVALEAVETFSGEPDSTITKARQILAMYYLLNGVFKLEDKNEASTAAIARFIHLLTGTKYTSIQNSEIYKKYQRMPNYKKGTHLIADLKFILPFFEGPNLEEVVKLINAEIAREMKELPLIERRKFDD